MTITQDFTHAIILDFEATCDDTDPPHPQEIIEFPSVLLELSSLTVVDSFEAFVRPHYHPTLTAFCKALTGIDQRDVDAADRFPTVFASHQAWLAHHGLHDGNALMVTCGDWDLKTMLPTQCAATIPPLKTVPAIYRRWQNVKRPFGQSMGTAKAPGMVGMLQALDLPLQGRHHRGIDDCRNITELYKALLRRGARVEVTGKVSQR